MSSHLTDRSAVATVIGILLLFSSAIFVTLLAPNYMDPTWTSPTSDYQVQMYEVADPNIYMSSSKTGGTELQSVYHLRRDYTLLAFQESETTRIVAPPSLMKYVTHSHEKQLKLTSRLMMLRKPMEAAGFNAKSTANKYLEKLQTDWVKANPDHEKSGLQKPRYEILELYEVDGDDAFAVASAERILENWVDKGQFQLLDEEVKQSFHDHSGVIYVNNPVEFRVRQYKFGSDEGWKYDPAGEPIASLDELRVHPLGFNSRADLIQQGEEIYGVEGCWYCHTDQTRTLIQDVVLNGGEAFPAPPSSANEYIYNNKTFPGTQRNGPDLSRVGVKRPSRDWHMSHFWAPKLESKGSIMPSFQHFFDYDPRGTRVRTKGVPNAKFEAIYQYLMTKGTRITPPTQAWWVGKDPVNTMAIIEGKKVVD